MGTKSKDETVDLNINWQGTGESVMVAADFNNWQPEEMTKGENGVWSIKKKLQVGKLNLKFIVDGKWVINENLDSVSDSEGNINNQINVQAHLKRQKNCSVGLKQTINETDIAMKETDTIKRSNKAKDKNISKSVEDRNEQHSAAVESNDSISSVTETENTVLIKDSMDEENISLKIQPVETKETADINRNEDIVDKVSDVEIGAQTETEISQVQEKINKSNNEAREEIREKEKEDSLQRI